jgi:hypothetical protein
VTSNFDEITIIVSAEGLPIHRGRVRADDDFGSLLQFEPIAGSDKALH